ncbi:hypothetical protein TWF696_008555 [Orbilia brochopaga]|uniref:Uncharacterized protein n=1 Tax=Orbilia brochopaga TaxID=3140254 RepID=A0AAV9UJL5_9PEZI
MIPMQRPDTSTCTRTFQLILERSSSWRSRLDGASGWEEIHDIEYADATVDPGRFVFNEWFMETFIYQKISPLPVALYNLHTGDLIMFEEMDQIPTMALGSRKIDITAGYCSRLHPIKGVMDIHHLEFSSADASEYPIADRSRSYWFAVYDRTAVGYLSNSDLGRFIDAFSRWLVGGQYLPILLLEDLRAGRLYLRDWDIVKVGVWDGIKSVARGLKWLYWNVLLPVAVALYLFNLMFQGGSGGSASSQVHNATLPNDIDMQRMVERAVTDKLNADWALLSHKNLTARDSVRLSVRESEEQVTGKSRRYPKGMKRVYTKVYTHIETRRGG